MFFRAIRDLSSTRKYSKGYKLNSLRSEKFTRVISPKSHSMVSDYQYKSKRRNKGFMLTCDHYLSVFSRFCDFRGLRFRGLRFRGLRFRGLCFRGLRFRGLRFRGLCFRGLSFRGLCFRGLWSVFSSHPVFLCYF